MPWKECNIVEERLRFIARLLDGERLDNRNIGNAAAFAHRLQAVTQVSDPQRMDQCGHQFRPGRAKWMTERNCTAIDVEL